MYTAGASASRLKQ